jgi:hypothetical protein
VVEFSLDGTKRAQREVEIPANGQVEVVFRTPANLAEGIHQGELRIASTDPVAFDDRRFVSFAVRPSYRVLLVHDDAAAPEVRDIDAVFVRSALDPYGFGRPCQVETIPSTRVMSEFPKPLASYSCVILNNVRQLPDGAWNQLAVFAREGGGVVIGLGDRSDPANYNGAQAGRILPAMLGEPKTPAKPVTFGQVADESHPLFARLGRELSADLATIPVKRYWEVNPAERTRTLLKYSDGAPALIERDFPGARVGRCLLWTTPLARRARPGDPAGWNEFPIAGWSFVALMDRTVPFLAGSAGLELNYEAGQDVSLPIETVNRSASYVIQGPEARAPERINPPANAQALVVQMPQTLGNWRIAAGDAAARSTLGFSLNPPVGEMAFTPLEKKDLTAIFGSDDAFSLADDPSKLERERQIARVGRELFPWLMMLILVLVTVEGFLANRFHREASTPSQAAGAGARR